MEKKEERKESVDKELVKEVEVNGIEEKQEMSTP